MMSLSENQADRVYWFNQASSLATQMKIRSLASLTAASMMFIFSSLHPKTNFESGLPSFSKQQLVAFVKKIDEARGLYTQILPETIPITSEAVTTFSVLMIGCKAELLFLLGDFVAAQQAAQWAIETACTLTRPVHISLFGVQCAAEVALALHMMPAINLATNLFEKHSRALPLAGRFKRRILHQLSLVGEGSTPESVPTPSPEASLGNGIANSEIVPEHVPLSRSNDAFGSPNSSQYYDMQTQPVYAATSPDVPQGSQLYHEEYGQYS